MITRLTDKKKVWLVAGVLILSITFYFAWSRRRESLAAAQNGSNVSTITVRRGTLEISVTGTSNVVPAERRVVKSEVSGTVAKLLVAEGQKVKAGQVIATISNPDIVNQYELAKADLDSQKLRLESYRSPSQSEIATVESQVSQARTVLSERQSDLAKLSVKSPISGRVLAVKVNPGDRVSLGQLLVTVVDDTEVLVVAQVAQQDINKVSIGQPASVGFGSELPAGDGLVYSIGAEASASGKTTVVPVYIRLANNNGVYRSGLAANVTIRVSNDETISASATVSPKQRYDIKAEVDGTVSSVAVREGQSVTIGQELVRLSNDNLGSALKKAESDLQVALENLDKVKSGLVPNISEADVKQQELKVRQSELTLSSRAADLEALQVKSPIDGTITSRFVSLGDTIDANSELFVVADLSSMEMTIAVDELDISNVKPGQKAKVTADALPGKTFDAEVTKVATEGSVKDGVASYDVNLKIHNPDGLLSGMTASATIVVAQKDNALMVPSEAIRSTGNRKSVMVMRNGSAVSVEVQTGLRNEIWTEITSGLQEGDSVVVSSLAATQQQGRQQMLNPFGGFQQRPQGSARPGGR